MHVSEKERQANLLVVIVCRMSLDHMENKKWFSGHWALIECHSSILCLGEKMARHRHALVHLQGSHHNG